MSFVTGNMHYIRAPFVREHQAGQSRPHPLRLLARSARLADRAGDLRGARRRDHRRAVRAPAGRLLRSALGRVRSDDEVRLQRAARLDRHAAQPRELHRDGGRHPVDLHGRRHDARMVPVRRRDRRHEADRGAQALCGEARVRPERARVPRHLALRHRVHLQRGEPHHPAAAAGRRASIPTRSSTSPRTRTGRATTCSTICSRPASSTSRRSKARPTASW